MTRWIRFGLLLAILAGICNASAQLIPVEDFAKHPEVSEISISPTGEYVAMIVPTEGNRESRLHIMRIDGTEAQAIRLGANEHLTDIVWSDDRRIVVSQATKEFGEERASATGRLYAVDVDAKNQELLFGYTETQGVVSARRNDKGFAWVARRLDGTSGEVLVGFNSWTQGEEPDTVYYRVNTHTGDRKEVERVKRAYSAIFDQSGRLRILVTRDESDAPLNFYRPTSDSELMAVPKTLAGYRVEGGYFKEDGNTVYAFISDKGEPAQLYRLDMAKGTREKIAGNSDSEISVEIGGNRGVPFAVTTLAGKPSVSYLDAQSEWAKLHAGLMQHFKGRLVNFINFTKNNRAVVFYVYSDRDAGSYYLYDLDKKKLLLLSQARPWMKPEQLAPTRPVEFANKSGTKLYGYYTANGTGAKPMVVIPHGGPFGIADTWAYDNDAQFLASRGYAVLQINYRGSGNRGQNFMESGWKHWGDDIQDDIADGVRWAIQNGLADPKRICIFGASFGGYSALMNPIRHADLYQCAIGYVGVYDLQLLRKTDSLARTKYGRRFLDRTVGTDEALLSQTSPAQQAAKIGIPVFLVHGKADETAKFDQYRAMEEALKKAGKNPETMVVASEGHGFYNPKNIAELYQRLEAFLQKHIGSQ